MIDIAEIKIAIDTENRAMYQAYIDGRREDAHKHMREVLRLAGIACTELFYPEERNR